MSKQSILTGLFLLLIPYLHAQLLHGTIMYDLKIDVHARMPPEMEEMKLRVPRYQTVKKELFFNPAVSLFKDFVDETETRGGGMMFRMWSGNSIVQLDLENDAYTERKSSFGEDFLLQGETPYLPWRIAPETKVIAGYTCQRAWHIQDSTEKYIEAWFTPEIPVAVGPEFFIGLPGAVLELDVQYGELNYFAVSVNPKVPKESDLRLPKGGKKVTKEEYDAYVQQKTKEMESSPGSRRFRGN
jgi:GLPGLI family protein